MPIRVTCQQCHTRFNVSENFAGKEGPCPKCKTIIKVPSKEEEVVIHAPTAGPKDSKGRQILKPITVGDGRLPKFQVWMIGGGLLAFPFIAFFLRLSIEDKNTFPVWISIASAIAMAVLISLGAYQILKDRELEDFTGKELWCRIAVCAAVYALIWAAMPIAKYAFGDKYETSTWITAITGMLAAGGAVGMLAFDFDFLTGLLHYGLYLGFCLLGRVIAGIGVLPGVLELSEASATSSMIAPTEAAAHLIAHPLFAQLVAFFFQ